MPGTQHILPEGQLCLLLLLMLLLVEQVHRTLRGAVPSSVQGGNNPAVQVRWKN